MVVIDGEAWVILPDGRLLSYPASYAAQLVAEGLAVAVPPERVERHGDSGFRLIPDPEPVIEAAVTRAPERASLPRPRGRSAG